MTLPKWLQDDNTKTKANKQEKRLANEIGARLTPNSGATPFRKGDMSLGDYLIESKATDKTYIKLDQTWLDKIEKEAIKERKTPLLIAEIRGKRYYIFREKDVELTDA